MPLNGDHGLTIQNVSHGYARPGQKHRLVLDRISFRIEAGEFVSVMGPSGCGKSTLIAICAGFVTPMAGQVSWEQNKIERPGRARGVVLQEPALYPWLNVRDNVLFGPHAGKGGMSRKDVDALLDEVGLKGYALHRPYELSGGMQHRVALARTLANKPNVLLMDEPFAALDAQTRSEMQDLLLRIWELHRATVMFVTHDIEEALLLSDRTVVLSRGPAEVDSIVDVPFARPRKYELVLEPSFVELRGRLRDRIVHITASRPS